MSYFCTQQNLFDELNVVHCSFNFLKMQPLFFLIYLNLVLVLHQKSYSLLCARVPQKKKTLWHYSCRELQTAEGFYRGKVSIVSPWLGVLFLHYSLHFRACNPSGLSVCSCRSMFTLTLNRFCYNLFCYGLFCHRSSGPVKFSPFCDYLSLL